MDEISREKYEKVVLALFGVVRNGTVMPIGIRKGKTMKEINKMTVETMKEIIDGDVIDYQRIRRSYLEGGGEFKEGKTNGI